MSGFYGRRIARAAVIVAFTLGFALQATTARAVVIVLGQGLAQNCYEAAFALSKGLTYIAPSLTGTQIDLSPVQLCTEALTQPTLVGRDLAGTHVNRGVLSFLEGDHVAALADFERAITIDNNIGEAHANRGASLVAMKRWADSIPAITKGIELQAAEMEKSYYNRAIANEELGNVRGAYFDYMKAAELKPYWEAPKMQLSRFSVRKKGS